MRDLNLTMNAADELEKFLDKGTGAQLDFLAELIGLINGDATIDELQKAFIIRKVQTGPTNDEALMRLATFINCCRG